jgi:hypothetical protein
MFAKLEAVATDAQQCATGPYRLVVLMASAYYPSRRSVIPAARAALSKPECDGLDEAHRTKHDQQGVACQLLPGRNSRELAHDEFEIAFR